MKLLHKILLHIIENKDKEFTIREISRILNVDYKNTYDAVMSLKDSITINKRANSNFITFKPVLTNDVYLVENLRKERLVKNSNIRLIYNDLKKIDSPFFIAIVFGSYAKNKQTKHSDIDICIIYHHDANKVYSALSIHNLGQIHSFNIKEFLSMIRTKSFNVGHEIVKDGIVLHGLENYYELIKDE